MNVEEAIGEAGKHNNKATQKILKNSVMSAGAVNSFNDREYRENAW